LRCVSSDGINNIDVTIRKKRDYDIFFRPASAPEEEAEEEEKGKRKRGREKKRKEKLIYQRRIERERYDSSAR